jgi:hypothetical protein
VKRIGWQLPFGAGLLGFSAAVYALSFVLFRDARDEAFYLLQDLAFLPITVLVVTLLVEGFLAAREKRVMLRKLNMVIGAFFSEAGAELLRRLGAFNTDVAALAQSLQVDGRWKAADYAAAAVRIRAVTIPVSIGAGDLPGLKAFIVARRGCFLGMLENPNLLEHETFTDLLWAVFHLTEELEMRADVAHLGGADRAHIEGDMTRAYGLLVIEWLAYMRHLSEDYPYLFSLAVRMNPFNPAAKAEIDAPAP